MSVVSGAFREPQRPYTKAPITARPFILGG
jgi:hypothetical protein